MAGENPAVAASGDWHGRRVVVTGGAGFLGSNLLHALVARGALATALDAALPGSGANPANLAGLEGRVARVDADLRTIDDAALADLLRDADAVFHLAAQTSHMASMEAPLEDLATNAIGTLRLLETLRHVNPRARFVHASGLNDRAVRQDAPYDLVFANILAPPLVALSQDIKQALRPGGVAILSGLLRTQERRVKAAYLSKGFRVVRRIHRDAWATLVLQRP